MAAAAQDDEQCDGPQKLPERVRLAILNLPGLGDDDPKKFLHRITTNFLRVLEIFGPLPEAGQLKLANEVVGVAHRYFGRVALSNFLTPSEEKRHLEMIGNTA